MTERQYVYKITGVVKVVDGDSYWLELDAGFRARLLVNIRLAGYDCPERYGGTEHEKAKAIEAHYEADKFLRQPPGTLWIRTEKDPDNFGRWLGHITVEYDTGGYSSLGDWLENLGLASLWPTRWRDQYEHIDAIPVEAP